MSDNTSISYCDATVSPVRGCTPASEGCANCFARAVAKRFWPHLVWDGEWRGAVELVPKALEQPLRWGKPRIILWPTMGDLFHQLVPNEYIAACFGAMASSPQHTHLVLTKRIERVPAWLGWLGGRVLGREHELCRTDALKLVDCERPGYERLTIDVFTPLPWPLPNVLIGCTVENQRLARERWPLLAEVAAMGWRTWLSLEPLLGPIHGLPVALWGHPATDDRVCDPAMPTTPEFVAVGAETGPGARPCKTEWIRSIVEQCRRTGVRCHVKQLSRGAPWNPDEWPRELVEMRAGR